MDRIIIINGDAGDDTVIKNDRAVNFPVDSLLPESSIWAVQWYGDHGEVEYSDDRQPASIGNLNAFTEVMAEYQRLIDIEDNPPPASLEDVRDEKLLKINEAAELAIVSGFSSSALGASHIYQSDRDDQLNLIGMVADGIDGLFKCEDGDKVKEYRLHTVAQLKQVLSDGKVVKLDHLQRAAVLKAQILSAYEAGDRDALEAVVWG